MEIYDKKHVYLYELDTEELSKHFRIAVDCQWPDRASAGSTKSRESVTLSRIPDSTLLNTS